MQASQRAARPHVSPTSSGAKRATTGRGQSLIADLTCARRTLRDERTGVIDRSRSILVSQPLRTETGGGQRGIEP